MAKEASTSSLSHFWRKCLFAGSILCSERAWTRLTLQFRTAMTTLYLRNRSLDVSSVLFFNLCISRDPVSNVCSSSNFADLSEIVETMDAYLTLNRKHWPINTCPYSDALSALEAKKFCSEEPREDNREEIRNLGNDSAVIFHYCVRCYCLLPFLVDRLHTDIGSLRIS